MHNSAMTAEQIKHTMAQKGLNAAQFAAKIGVNAQHLRAVLRGERPVTGKLTRQVAMIDELEPERIAAAVVSVRLPSGAVSAHIAGADDLTPADLARVWERVGAYAAAQQARIEAAAELRA